VPKPYVERAYDAISPIKEDEQKHGYFQKIFIKESRDPFPKFGFYKTAKGASYSEEESGQNKKEGR
jgi:hypothetical protein